jgi:anti-sigma28 factor (negative regulator of flagellin synthesis)
VTTPAHGAATTQDPTSEPSIRTDLVERIRREIADGTYETPEKWDIALDRLLDRLEGQEPPT